VGSAQFGKFAGRVGLWNNQPGDRLLDQADVVVTVGYNPVEYEPPKWKKDVRYTLIHIDVVQADADRYYRPEVELVGNIATTLELLAAEVGALDRSPETNAILVTLATARPEVARRSAALEGSPIHPRCASSASCRTSLAPIRRCAWIWAASISGSRAICTASMRGNC
jgi:acetolactate synthase I/II/III large subunit